MKILFLCLFLSGGLAEAAGIIYLRPGQDIQAALDRAAKMNPPPELRFRPGIYRPLRRGQALLHLNRQHDGLRLLAEGAVTLTAENRMLADPRAPSFPAAVNHVIYVGDGVGPRTRIEGFRIEGARGHLSREGEWEAEPSRRFPRHVVFYADGGGIKIFGAAAPVLSRLVFSGNRAFYCGGAISVEQRGATSSPVRILDSIFEANEAPLTGGALDLLPGSRAVVERALFLGNRANEERLTPREREEGHARLFGRKEFPPEWRQSVRTEQFARSAAVTVFAGSSLELRDSLFLGNGAGLEWSDSTAWYWREDPPVTGGFLQISRTLFWGNAAYALRRNEEFVLAPILFLPSWPL